MIRLEALSPDLTDKLRRASAAKQRAASVAASEFAIAHAQVDHPLVDRALESVRAGEALTPKVRAELDALAKQLDEEYLELQDAAEEGRANADEYMSRFGQARAVASLFFTGKHDAFEAATEAIYEAAATTDDKEELSALIRSVLE